jgi:putative ABC transport system permease protein
MANRVPREYLRRLWGTFRRGRGDREVAEELRLHLELAAEDARRRGGSAADAIRAARLRAGGIPQAMEAMRDQRGLPWLEDFRRDVLYALGALRRNPGFAAVAVITLALGIGANTAIFSIVNAVLLRPLPYSEPGRLVSAGQLLGGEYLFFRDHAQSVDAIALYRGGVGLNLSQGGEADRLTGAQVSANLFSVLGISAARGRGFLPAEEQPAESRVVVISHALWRQRFGGDASIVGRDIEIDGVPRRVVGVMPPAFSFPSAATDLWIPYAFNRGNAGALWGGGQRGQTVARLAPGATPAQAQSELRARAPELRKANTLWVFAPEWGANREVVLLQDRLVGDVRTRLLIILGAVGFVLLIACANVANLLLARASTRQHEVAIRHALGAGRGRMARQLLTESAVLGLLGGAAGFLLAFLAVPVLVSGLSADIPRVEEIAVDGWVLGFTMAAGLLTGLVFGAVPAIRSLRSDSNGSLKAGTRGSSASMGRAAALFVVAEIAVAVLLVIGAGLLIRSFAELLRVDPGFRSEQIVTARITPPAVRYPDETRTRALYAEVLARVAALPGVQDVEAVSHLPLVGGSSGFAFEVEGKPYVQGTGAPTTGEHAVTPGYLQVMGIPLREGRLLAPGDRDAPAVAVINETMARDYWPGEKAVGKRLKPVWKVDGWITVVGVVGDIKYSGLAKKVEPEIYRPFLQAPERDMSLVVRTAVADPTTLAASLRQAVASVDAMVPVSEIRTVDQLLARSVATPRVTTMLLALFAAVALTLAAIGIYGVLSYTVSRRTREIGVRMALGARRGDVLRMMMGHALLLAGLGTTAGVAAALATTRALDSLLFGVSRTDMLTFAIVPVLLLIVAVIAAYVPASRATRVDPMIALRLE